MIGIYKAVRLDNGEEVEGNLIYQDDSPFAYILTKENFSSMVVNELNDCQTSCNLIRVMKKTIKKVD
ncbi:TPA: hypothetical protein I9080_002102 [Clostridium perfringens]|uniref:Uncharacterized protein n=2 Tax=Clostridium perfringens TaxID=1502 RepID=A0A8H9R007_CLOPF|nr:hypothetical protein [Clostridium perfringens]EDT15766.1 hypothetical protein AC3_A0186 [Clostridium perfringens E str. JGS1987]MCX0407808.1 hypothetical protein [Clostridium perfringens]HAT4308292.1 hypothetical protein [Clostridium perfringens]